MFLPDGSYHLLYCSLSVKAFLCDQIECDNEMASATTIDSDSAWFAPSITVEQFGTEDSCNEIPDFTSHDGQLTLPTFNGMLEFLNHRTIYQITFINKLSVVVCVASW